MFDIDAHVVAVPSAVRLTPFDFTIAVAQLAQLVNVKVEPRLLRTPKVGIVVKLAVVRLLVSQGINKAIWSLLLVKCPAHNTSSKSISI